MIPRADDPALARDDRAYRRIRARLACATPGQRKGLRHESLVLPVHNEDSVTR
jgi:hypothetical protein